MHLLLEVLLVKTWLHRKGIFVPCTLNCDLCGGAKTLRHIIVHCFDAYLFWDDMRTKFQLRAAFDIEWANLKYTDLGERDTAQVA